MKRKSGFTLVEILIVVVILGILAAIVIPQFTNASSEAKLSSLKSNLQSIRAQIELFKIRNDDCAPTVANFVTKMTTRDANGNGPYLQSIPTNPYTNSSNVVGWGVGGGAWELDPDGSTATSGGIGAFRAGDTDHQSL